MSQQQASFALRSQVVPPHASGLGGGPLDELDVVVVIPDALLDAVVDAVVDGPFDATAPPLPVAEPPPEPDGITLPEETAPPAPETAPPAPVTASGAGSPKRNSPPAPQAITGNAQAPRRTKRAKLIL